MTAHVIRQKFLDFFKTKGHEIVSSAPMVIKGVYQCGDESVQRIFFGEQSGDQSPNH